MANLQIYLVDTQLNKHLDEQQINQPVASVDAEWDNDEEDGKSGKNEEISAPELNYYKLTVDDVLHGYTPDNVYVANIIDEDGNYIEDLNWTYHQFGNKLEDIEYPHKKGSGPCLKPCVSLQFET